MDLYEKLSNNVEELAAIFKTRMDSHENELQKASGSISTPDLNTLSREFADFKQFVITSLTLLKSQVDLLLLGLDRHEMASRRKVLLIHGLSESTTDTIPATVTKLLTGKMQVSSECANSISVCHRLGTSTDTKSKPRPILVRFSNVAAKSTVWAAKTELKGSGVVVSEFLTKSRHDVFMAARKHFGVQGCWTMDGKIVVLLPDKSRARVEQMSDLRSLMEKFPSKGDNALKPKPSKKTTEPKTASYSTRRAAAKEK